MSVYTKFQWLKSSCVDGWGGIVLCGFHYSNLNMNYNMLKWVELSKGWGDNVLEVDQY